LPLKERESAKFYHQAVAPENNARSLLAEFGQNLSPTAVEMYHNRMNAPTVLLRNFVGLAQDQGPKRRDTSGEIGKIVQWKSV
jgi:hypothetical protein